MPAVLQALKELNLANWAPELSAHYGFPLEPKQVSTEEVPDFVSAYLSRPTTTHLSIGAEEDQRPGIIISTGPQGSHCQYPGITKMTEPSKQTGQIHTLILIEYVQKKGLLINLDMETGQASLIFIAKTPGLV